MDAHMADKCTSIFIKYDTDGNGTIDSKELKNLLADISMEFGSSPPSDEKVEAVFKIVDSDSSGTISKAELWDFLISVWGITAPTANK